MNVNFGDNNFQCFAVFTFMVTVIQEYYAFVLSNRYQN